MTVRGNVLRVQSKQGHWEKEWHRGLLEGGGHGLCVGGWVGICRGSGAGLGRMLQGEGIEMPKAI